MPPLCLVLLALALAACAPSPPRPARPAPPAAAAPSPPPPPGATTAPAAPAAPGEAKASGEAPADESDGTPPGFVRLPQTAGGGQVVCGRFRVENVFDDPDRYEPRVVVRDEAGRVVYQARGRRYGLGPGEPGATMALAVDLCGDLTGDGVPELVMIESTMGAHCCYTHYVVSLTSPPKRLMMWEKGDGGGGLRPEKLKPGPAWQLTHTELVWPPFDVAAGDPPLSYAGVPGFPIVFDLVGGAYKPRTFLFQDALRRKRQESDEICARDPKPCEGLELIDWGWALILGDWGARKATLVKDDEFRQVLDKRASAMKKRLRAQLGP